MTEKPFPIEDEAQCLDANNFLVITHKSESLNLGKLTLKIILVSVSHTKNTQEKNSFFSNFYDFLKLYENSILHYIEKNQFFSNFKCLPKIHFLIKSFAFTQLIDYIYYILNKYK
jgi:hypothetical protein